MLSPNKMKTVLEVKDLKMHFPLVKGLMRRRVGTVKAVDGVNLSVREGETVSLVGESGCGKSTLGRTILRAYDPTEGQVLYRPRGRETSVDLAATADRDMTPYRTALRMVFQDPFTSLNPRLPVADIIAEPLKANNMASGSEAQDRVADMMRKVGLRPEYRERYPHAFSGGERQRIVIARALVTEPHIVVADEAVSALDVSVKAQTLNLLQDLQEDLDLTYLFVSHDLSVVEHISDRIAVMYVGKLVEFARAEDLFSRPRHPYTEALFSAIPISHPRLRGKTKRVRLPGDVADPANPPAGCPFHPRCGYATDLCKREVPPVRQIAAEHTVACHHADTLSLKGVL